MSKRLGSHAPMSGHTPARTEAHDRWHATADVVVVGYGYAGAVAAIEAYDAGADVLVIEKMPDPGGISSPRVVMFALSRTWKKASV